MTVLVATARIAVDRIVPRGAIALTVLEPTSNGIGSDVFSLVWDGNSLHGLNGSGRAPAVLSNRTCWSVRVSFRSSSLAFITRILEAFSWPTR